MNLFSQRTDSDIATRFKSIIRWDFLRIGQTQAIRTKATAFLFFILRFDLRNFEV